MKGKPASFMGGYGTLPLATTITLLLATVGTPGTRPPYPLPLGQGADLGSVFRDLAVEEGGSTLAYHTFPSGRILLWRVGLFIQNSRNRRISSERGITDFSRNKFTSFRLLLASSIDTGRAKPPFTFKLRSWVSRTFSDWNLLCSDSSRILFFSSWGQCKSSKESINQYCLDPGTKSKLSTASER